jgi:hypothetical protein
MNIKHITPLDYSYMKNISWEKKVEYAEVTFTVSTGDIEQTIKANVGTNGMGLYEALVDQRIITESDHVREEINDMVNRNVDRYCERKIKVYKSGVRINNELVDLVVKDKRTTVWEPEKNNGAVRPEELVIGDRISNLSNEEFSGRLSDDAYPVYITAWAHPSITKEPCKCSIKFWMKDKDDVTDMPYSLPEFTLGLKSLVSREDSEGLLRRKEHIIDLIYSGDRGMYHSYMIQETGRRVKLNTFIAMVRQYNREKESLISKSLIENVNYIKMLAKLQEMYPGLPISKKEVYRTSFNRNFYDNWGRKRYLECIVVEFPDSSELFYNSEKACGERELVVSGMFDASPMTSKQAVKKLINQNK